MLRGPPAAHSTGSPSRRQHKSCRPRSLMSDLDGFPTRIAMKPTFGTLEWGKKNNGVLTRTEQFHFLRNMAFLAAREVTDVIRAKLGLLKPVISPATVPSSSYETIWSRTPTQSIWTPFRTRRT